MDRSYLSDAAVVEASRKFICIRIAAYENKVEYAFMTAAGRFRSKAKKNSIFAIMDSAAKTHLVKPGRSPQFTFDDGLAMAKRMNEIIKETPRKKAMAPSRLGLPYLESVRVALNVSACDSQRTVVVYALNARDRKKLEKMLTPLAWSGELVGNLLYVAADEKKDLSTIKGADTKAPGLIVVEPNEYGTAAKQVAFIALGTTSTDAKKALIAAAEGNESGSKDSRAHVRKGRAKGLKWKHPVKAPK